MRSASQLVAGMPLGQSMTHRCAVCGGLGADVPIDEVCGSLTTDFPSFRDPSSSWCCSACALVRGRVAHPSGRESGWFCNFSHFVDADRVENASKGEKPKILAWLRGKKRGPWACAIADTGQKHVLCYAPVNLSGRGRVRFEELDVALPDESGWAIVDELVELLTAGATKEELETGSYGARAWQLCGVALAEFERRHGGARGSGWFALALWLAQRDEDRVAARLEAEKEEKRAKTRRKAKRAAPNAARGDTDGVPKGVPADPTGEDAGALAHPARPDAGIGEVQPECGRVGHSDSQVAADSTTGQLDLFGSSGAVALRPRARGVAGDAPRHRSRAGAARSTGTADG